MRFDNPIKNHKFKLFKDIAEFEEVKNEFRNKQKFKLNKIKNYYLQNDLTNFNKELDKIYKSTKEIYLNNEEKKYQIKLRKTLNKYFKFYQNFKVYSKKYNHLGFKELYKHGGYIFKINKEKLIDNEIKKKIKLLKKRKDWRPPPGTFDKWIDLSGNYKIKINKILKENKVIDICNAYYSRTNMKVTHARLNLCKPTDNSWKQFLYDCKKITQHTNLHMDPLEGVLKIMINISEVKNYNGPTAFLPKSNRYIYDPLQSLFARSIAIGNYCHNPISRRAVFRLPSFLRVTTNFGRLIKDNSNEAKYLSKNLKYLTEEKGNCLLFDPGATIHNGGVVKSGSRISIQVVIE